MWESRVLRRAFERLELHEGKLSRAVLRGGGGGDVTSLPDPGWATTPVYPASSCTSASWPAGEGRPWCYAGNATRTFTPDAGTEQRPKKAVTGKPDDIERVTSGLAGGRRERSRKTTSPAAYPTTSARTSSETVGGDDELHRAYKIHRFVVKDLRGKSRAHSVCGCAFFLGDRSIRDPSR